MSDVDLKISGDDTGLLAVLEEAKTAVATSTAEMQASFEGLSAGFEKIRGSILAITGLLAGGALFKEAIGATVEWQEGAGKLSRSLGISTESASAYQVALARLGISDDVLIKASQQLSQHLATNAGAFEQLGIKTKDSNGQFLAAGTILQATLERLAAIKNPVEQNIAGIALFGRSWGELRILLRLTSAQLDDSAERAKALGLVVGEDSPAQAHKYQEALADLSLVGKAFEVLLGQQLIPTLTSVGLAFAEQGPSMMSTFGQALQHIAQAADGVYNTLKDVGDAIAALLAAAGAALAGNFAGAREVMHELKADLDANEAAYEKFRDKLAEPLAASPLQGPDPKDKGGLDTTKTKMAELEAGLAQNKAIWTQTLAAQGDFEQFSKEQELEYWQGVLASTKLNSADKLAIQKKIWDDEAALGKQATDAQLAQLKAQEGAHTNDLAARLQAELAYAAAVQQSYGENSKEYGDAEAAIVATQRQVVAQQLELDQMRAASSRTAAETEIQNEQAAAKAKLDTGRIGLAQYLELERTFEAQLYALKQEALAEQLQLEEQDPDRNAGAIAKQLATVEQLAQAHQQKMNQITQSGITQQNALFKTFQTSLQSGFATAFKGIITGTMTVSQAFTKLWTGLLDAVATTLAQIAAKWVVQTLLGLAADKTQGTAAAGLAAANAMSSAAALPLIGWAIAPEVGASIFQQAMAYASAARGYDVPSGINPVTQLHSREMVLPANLAEAVRNRAASGSAGGDLHVHFNEGAIQAIDAPSFGNFLMRGGGGDEIIKHIERHVQNNGRIRL